MALDSQLEAGRHETAFLVPGAFHKSLKNLQRNVLDIDYRPEQLFRDEMAACGRFRPDVIVDDFSMAALLTSKVAKKPRVTILRTGAFPGSVPRDDSHRHSCESHSSDKFDFDAYFQNSELLCGIPAPKNFAEACAADISIVPGIRSIEALPASVGDDPNYAFAGALTVSDSAIPTPVARSTDTTDAILAFLERNQQRKIVYLTLGSVLKAGEAIREAIKYMLDTGVAIISTVDLPDVKTSRKELFFYAPFVPMHAVCSKVHLMIHHCGSGTYQYAITHQVPSICIGSRSYDRDDVAYRLEQLGVAKYIPFIDSVAVFIERFVKEFDQCMDNLGQWYQAAKQRLNLLWNENDRTAAIFNFEEVLKKAILLHGANLK
ncbi:hypothetical protein DVJ77_18920 [Dyella tabacisoli]|uniref:Glycosyl transferase family 28 C-terminal domain-containing protein n=2 Tax=Dyella tabacisoli TaxID=2282381 RepID=A0A369UIN6_9GAMM|nr:hypothetical protein DVJ77_18920 [Dyella tabacisoli]